MSTGFLLDTHVWIWRHLEPERISAAAQEALGDSGAELYLSPISVWETLLLARKGRLELEPTPVEFVLDALRRSALSSIPISNSIALLIDALDGFASEDPADRFLVASALEHDLTLVSADRAMHAYEPVMTLW